MHTFAILSVCSDSEVSIDHLRQDVDLEDESPGKKVALLPKDCLATQLQYQRRKRSSEKYAPAVALASGARESKYICSLMLCKEAGFIE